MYEKKNIIEKILLFINNFKRKIVFSISISALFSKIAIHGIRSCRKKKLSKKSQKNCYRRSVYTETLSALFKLNVYTQSRVVGIFSLAISESASAFLQTGEIWNPVWAVKLKYKSIGNAHIRLDVPFVEFFYVFMFVFIDTFSGFNWK